MSEDPVKVFLGYLELQEGAPYIWGGRGETVWTEKGLHRHAHGCNVFDCSGLITRALKEAGGKDWRATHNADVLWRELEPVEKPEPGDLVFYGSLGRATHVEAVMPDGRYFGALNGGPHTLVANPSNARVRYRVKDRPDRLGFRCNPLRKP